MEKNMTGSLTIFTGCMFSNKTTKLIQEITRYADATISSDKTHPKPLLINNALDSRSLETVISSHSSAFRGISSRIDIVSAKSLKEVDVSKHDVIGIDECQFFEDLYEITKYWLSKGKHIYCAGLNGDANMKHFGQIHMLLPLCDNFEFLHAICQLCMEEKKKKSIVLTPVDLIGMKASFSKRIIQSSDQIDIGASDKYVAVCRKHFEC
jgi:thymidine kinase